MGPPRKAALIAPLATNLMFACELNVKHQNQAILTARLEPSPPLPPRYMERNAMHKTNKENNKSNKFVYLAKLW